MILKIDSLCAKYAGKNESLHRDFNSSLVVVKRLAAPIKGSGRNITNLYLDVRATLVGTLQANCKHIPDIIKRIAN